MTNTIGFIGLGLMGRPMAKNLLKAGFPVVVHSRSQGPVDDLVASGALRASSPGEVARGATRIITMLPDSPDVELVLDWPDGVFASMQPGTIVIDMSTIAPATAQRLAARAASLGAVMLDAPVSGGEIGAISGTLSIMVGGDEAAFSSVRPLLNAMGNPERVIRIGDSGAGQICKACNQMVIGGTLAVVSEAFALARKAGVDPAAVRAALLGGFAASRVLEVHGERILNSKGLPHRLGDAGGASQRRARERSRPATRRSSRRSRPLGRRLLKHGEDRVRALRPRSNLNDGTEAERLNRT
jgi:2-hydroxy-3-oxopropionate reductase